ncbi:MAG TPA: CoA-binding protein [Polyangiaceae bacterium]|nr:CoA-binding protein [Polyangiaceae bacterium]
MVTEPTEIARIAAEARRVAVLGIKTERQAEQPAFYVPEYLVRAGLEVIPIPVYYPEVTEILGAQVVRRVQDVPGDIDILDVFRRPEDLMAHLDDILVKRPTLVWLQSGIRHPGFAQRLVEAGIDVVQDRCLMVEHRRGSGRA